MSRTRHHSRKWGRDSRWANRSDRAGYSGNRSAGEGRNWFVHLHDIVPARRADKALTRCLALGHADPDEAVSEYLGTRRPHTWDW